MGVIANASFLARSLAASDRDLPVHKARQEKVAGLGEFLILLIQFAGQPEIGFGSFVELVEQFPRRQW